MNSRGVRLIAAVFAVGFGAWAGRPQPSRSLTPATRPLNRQPRPARPRRWAGRPTGDPERPRRRGRHRSRAPVRARGAVHRQRRMSRPSVPRSAGRRLRWPPRSPSRAVSIVDPGPVASASVPAAGIDTALAGGQATADAAVSGAAVRALGRRPRTDAGTAGFSVGPCHSRALRWWQPGSNV